MKSASKIFWNWFTNSYQAYEQLDSIKVNAREELLNDFERELHTYCNKLYFEIGGLPGQSNELIITAEGDTNYFEQVDQLIDDAPITPNWIFIAFKPPMPGHFKTKWGNIELDTQDIYFNPSNGSDSSGIGIIMYLKKYDDRYEDDYYNALFKMLDTVLGEKSFALDIKNVVIKLNEGQIAEDDMLPLLKLPAYIKWYKSKRV